jgi:hypothetical protein
MTNLFQRAAVFTDIHFGLKSNSVTHNDDCLNFVRWFCNTAKENNCETCFFLGDWHNNRASVNIMTLDYSLKSLELLSQNFSRVFFIPGNHDLYYKDRRDIQSAEWARHIPNVEIVNDFFQEGDVSIVPWLVGDDHKKITKINAQYMFGHFELPHFYMNAMVKMPEHGEVRRENFGHIGRVFSGHFHKRQTGANITYLGNAFPHNYADAGDDARGMMILEWGQEPKFLSWPQQPTFRVYDLSQLLERADDLLKPDMHVRVNLDINISYEEANFIKETFNNTYSLREIALIPKKLAGAGTESTPGNIEFKSVDQIVVAQLNEIKSEHFDNSLLLDIYRSL